MKYQKQKTVPTAPLPPKALDYLDLLKRFEKAYYFFALIYAVAVDKVSCSVRAVNLVAFRGFLVADATCFEHSAAVAVS